MPEELPTVNGLGERVRDHEVRIRRVEEYVQSHDAASTQRWAGQHRHTGRLDKQVNSLREELQTMREEFVAGRARVTLIIIIAGVIGNAIVLAALGVIMQRLRGG